MQNLKKRERQRRWRLLLGQDAQQLGPVSGQDARLDQALGALYQPGFDRAQPLGAGGGGQSMPQAARWLGEIQKLFPASAVAILQKDATERLDLAALVQDPAFLEAVQPDVELVAQLLALRHLIPDRAKQNARMLVQRLVEALMRKHRPPMEQAVRGARNRAVRNPRPRPHEIDWNATIRRNLKTYRPEYNALIPERLVGHGRRQRRMNTLILCVDQSGSMGASVIYSSIFAAVLASFPSLRTHLVLFDTAVVDWTESLQDPVEVLFGIQLGGGTDIARALTYCENLVEQPAETHLVLISDLCEGGSEAKLLQTAHRLLESGVNLITLLALSDEGAPWFDRKMAAQFTALGSPAFACTPDLFGDLMAVALERRDLRDFASQNRLPIIIGSTGMKRE